MIFLSKLLNKYVNYAGNFQQISIDPIEELEIILTYEHYLNNHNFYTEYQTRIEKSQDLHEIYHGNEGEMVVEYSSFAPQYQDPQLET